MEKMVEGNKTTSETIKEHGQAISHESEHSGSGKFAYHGQELLPRIGFEAGRTIELRQYEFCRIKLGVYGCLIKGVGTENGFDAAKEFVLEMLKREEGAVVGRKYEAQISSATKTVLGDLRNRSIYIVYGLTLKAARGFESHQVDVIEEMPVSDGDDLMVAFEKLSDELAAFIDEQQARIKNIGKDAGI